MRDTLDNPASGGRVVITGGTGFIGSALASRLAGRGYHVAVVSRSARKVREHFGNAVSAVSWDGDGESFGAAVDGAFAVVNLAGENIGDSRWSSEKKDRILESRLEAGRKTLDAIEKAAARPRVLIQASAIGYYGNRPGEILDESAAAGDGFLSDVCVRWEESTRAAEDMGVRRAVVRTAVVLDRTAQIIEKLKLPYLLFLGGHPGSGEQGFTWIHRDDEVAAIHFLLEEERASGPFNLAGPEPSDFRTFSELLAGRLGRPSWFPLPGALLKIALGEMAEEMLLSGQRAIPKKLLDLGFRFSYPTLDKALAACLP